jgi:deoxyribodipyrimidine photo-lyase
MKVTLSVFWFRRDLRLDDNAGLYHALKSGLPVLSLFIFDRNILDKIEDRHDKRVDFIHQQIKRLRNELQALGSDLKVCYGDIGSVWEQLEGEYNIEQVFTNRDYEPGAVQRDQDVQLFLNTKSIMFYSYKDQCIFEKDEIVKDDGTPYTIFTPYSKKWKMKLSDFYLSAYPAQ